MIKNEFFFLLPSRGVGARNAGKRVVVSHALAVEGGGGDVRASYVPRIPKGARGPLFCVRGRVKKANTNFVALLD